jgi:hypothetical protein
VNEDKYQRDQDSGGVSPAISSPPASTKSDVGKVTHRASNLDGDASCMGSGASSIDPGGKGYSSRKSSTDQD